MATWEMQLLSRVIRTGDLTSVVSWGIGTDDFLTSEGRQMYEFISSYSMQAASAGSVIGMSSMTQFFPNFILCDDGGMTTPALCKQVRHDRLTVQLRNEAAKGLEYIEHDPLEAAARLNKSTLDIVNLGYGRTTDFRAAIGAEKVHNRYMLRAQGVDMSCGRLPWEILDDEMNGISDDDYIVLFGRPKSFKSWILVHILAHLLVQNKRILVYTKEMTWEQMYERIICSIAGIHHWNLRKGLLSPSEFVLFEQTVQMMQLPEISNQIVILSGIDASGSDTPAWVRSKIENYKPNFVFIDGLHLMADANKAKKREERITNISRDTRNMVLQTGVPVIATVQANRSAAKNQDANLDEIAYSDALGQDATCVIRTIKDKPTEEQPESTVSLVIGAMRNGVLDGFRINAEPAIDFSFHSRLSAYEAATLKDQDDKSPDGVAKKHAKATNGNGTKKYAPNTEGTAAEHGKKQYNRSIASRPAMNP